MKREVAQELVELYSASKFSKADHGGLQKIKPDKAIHAFLW